MAFAIAGARPTMGHSPAPAEGRSLRSSRTVSRAGTSLNRGMRYFDILPLRILPFSNCDRFKQRSTQPLDVGSFDLIAEVVGIHDGAALESGNNANDFHVAELAITTI